MSKWKWWDHVGYYLAAVGIVALVSPDFGNFWVPSWIAAACALIGLTLWVGFSAGGFFWLWRRLVDRLQD